MTLPHSQIDFFFFVSQQRLRWRNVGSREEEAVCHLGKVHYGVLENSAFTKVQDVQRMPCMWILNVYLHEFADSITTFWQMYDVCVSACVHTPVQDHLQIAHMIKSFQDSRKPDPTVRMKLKSINCFPLENLPLQRKQIYFTICSLEQPIFKYFWLG